MAQQAWIGRLVLDADSKDVAFTDATASPTSINVSLTPAAYYVAGYTGEGSNQLCESLQAAIRANGDNWASATVSFSYTTGKVTITLVPDSGTTSITWTDADLRDLLGFTASDATSGANAYTGSQKARGVWLPTNGPSDHPVDVSNFWEDESMTVVHRSLDGTIAAIEGQLLERAQVTYRWLPDTDVITPSTGERRGTFEALFADVIHAGQPLRVFYDRTSTGSAAFTTAVVGDGDGPLGPFTEYVRREIPSSNLRWRVELPLLKFA